MATQWIVRGDHLQRDAAATSSSMTASGYCACCTVNPGTGIVHLYSGPVLACGDKCAESLYLERQIKMLSGQ